MFGSFLVLMGYIADTLKVEKADKKRMMKECRDLFLKSHPEFRGSHISQRFMFRKLVDFYLEK